MSKTIKTYPRFTILQRIEHVFMLLSFTILGLTGIPQRYPTNGFAASLVHLLHGVENTRNIHHLAAIALMLVTAHHILVVGYKLYVLRVRATMLPSFQDAKDAWQAFTYNIRLGKKAPKMGRYTYEEKVEYWALVWGTVIMGLTGFMMWNPITTTRYFPGEFIPAAKAAHSAEAVLAVLAVLIWHMYSVHIKRFNKAMWTGGLTEEEMQHEHPLELAEIKAGEGDAEINKKTLRKRQLIYFPIAGVLATLMLMGVYAFVQGEETAITTYVPKVEESLPVYAPQTPTPFP